MFTLYGRVSGTFKDPNVLGAYLVLPALFALQSVVSDRFGKALRSTIVLGVLTLAVLLAFSRAAWGLLAITAGGQLIGYGRLEENSSCYVRLVKFAEIMQ